MNSPLRSTELDSAADLQTARQADPSRLSNEARYRFHERLGILAGSATPTAAQVAIAWREAAAYDRAATAASPLQRRTAE
jgi:hypothetical protein